MNKIVIIPDSFKGSMSSKEACVAVSSVIKKYYPSCEVVNIPVADGGEGTLDAFLQLKGAKEVTTKATSASGELINSSYVVMGDTAIIEIAKVVGLSMFENDLNPLTKTTLGVGELIKHAVDSGYKKIVIGLGGSCTNDGGTGMAQALGVKFFDKLGEIFIPAPDTLYKISNIDVSDAKDLLQDCSITAMCDINNPMYGPNGAAYVYAPQKGADEAIVKILDKNLEYLSDSFIKYLDKDVANVQGSGAAGALGAGIIAFLNGRLESGINVLLDILDFDSVLENTDFVITGEGKIDQQSMQGKAVMGIAKRAKNKDIPIIVFTGNYSYGAEDAYDEGVDAIFSITPFPADYNSIRNRSIYNLKRTTESVIRLLKAVEKKI